MRFLALPAVPLRRLDPLFGLRFRSCAAPLAEQGPRSSQCAGGMHTIDFCNFGEFLGCGACVPGCRSLVVVLFLNEWLTLMSGKLPAKGSSRMSRYASTFPSTSCLLAACAFGCVG